MLARAAGPGLRAVVDVYTDPVVQEERKRLDVAVLRRRAVLLRGYIGAGFTREEAVSFIIEDSRATREAVMRAVRDSGGATR